MKKGYQIFLLLYIVTGVSIGGYYSICPTLHRINANSRAEIMMEEFNGPQFKEGNEIKITVLVTIVGSILIGGIGFIKKND